MNSLLFVKGLIGLMVFAAASGALILQLQSRRRIPALVPLKPPRLVVWHRWLGRIALYGFLFNGVLCLLIGIYPAPRLDPRHLAHGALSISCAALFFSKIWVTRRKAKWGMRRIVPWGVALFALQTGIFLSATVFAIWARLAGLA